MSRHARVLHVLILFACVALVRAQQSSINLIDRHAYAANTGWIDACVDGTNGAVIGRWICSGWLYGVNIGWVHMGNGSPANGFSYGNTSADDYGVNHDGLGKLNGLAYGANVGWLCFEQAYGQPQVDLQTGNLIGHVWGANIGWISLSNSQAHVRTEYLDNGPDIDTDQLPDAWEYEHTNTLTAFSGLAGVDADSDGATDLAEWLADTDPLDDKSQFRVTAFKHVTSTNELVWPCRSSRQYRLERISILLSNDWQSVGAAVFPSSSATLMTGAVESVATTVEFYRVRCVVPLAP